MIDFKLISIALFSHALAVISPGPDFVLALKNSLTYSRKIGIFTAIGFGLGIGVHVLYSLLGLALLIKESILIFNLIKYFGALYLIYIGVNSFMEKDHSIQLENQIVKKEISEFKALSMGFLTNVLNPKASLFFLSLFTYIIQSQPSHITLGIISLSMMLNTAIWFSLVAIFFNIPVVQKQYINSKQKINKVLGVILIIIAFLIIFQ